MALIVLLVLCCCLVGMIQQQEPQAVLRPLSWFIPDPDQLARHKDADEIRRRGEDMAANGFTDESVGRPPLERK